MGQSIVSETSLGHVKLSLGYDGKKKKKKLVQNWKINKIKISITFSRKLYFCKNKYTSHRAFLPAPLLCPCC